MNVIVEFMSVCCHSRLLLLLHMFNGPLGVSGTTQVSRYQKGKTNQDFTEARDSEWHVASAGPYASLHLAPDRKPRQHPTTRFFYRPDALPAAQPTVSEHWRQKFRMTTSIINKVWWWRWWPVSLFVISLWDDTESRFWRTWNRNPVWIQYTASKLVATSVK